MEQKQVQNQTQTGVKSISQFLNNPNVLEKFSNILGEKAQGFISAVLTIVNQSDNLKNASPESIYTAALLAASLDLPINPNFGFAYIVPYFNGKTKKQEAQFQIGYKGLKQLAIRSGQFKTIIAKEVFEGQLIDDNNSILGYRFDWSSKTSDKVIGYVSYFSLLSGYESTYYMPLANIQKHALKYSQTFKKGFGLWNEDFDKMALKTVSKLHLNSGEAPLSIEMQKVVIADQSVIKNADTLEVEYVDNTQMTIEDQNQLAERNSLIEFIQKAKDTEALEMLEVEIDRSDDELVMIFEAKRKEIIKLEALK
jgi:recombination protein RecT